MAEGPSPRFWFTDISSISKDAISICTAKWELLQTKYKDYVLQNPELASKVETMLKILSYALPGRFGTSETLSELLYSASQLLTLMHDGIFRVGKGIPDYKDEHQGSQLVLWLTVIEYLEVFIELGAEKSFGEVGKWLLVIVVQIVKATLRLILLFNYKSGIQRSPLIAPLDRKVVIPEKEEEEDKSSEQESASAEKEAQAMGHGVQNPLWKGSRSGRVMRKLTAAPEDGFRTWELPPPPTDTNQGESTEAPMFPTELSTKKLFGESLYITRPLIHLSSMFMFGQNSWKPWLLSLGTDLTSMCLLGDSKELNAKEQAEMSRRTLLLLFYMLRSPFYDSYSKAKVVAMLKFINDKIPGMSLLVTPMMDYLPTWQKVYFYNWTI